MKTRLRVATVAVAVTALAASLAACSSGQSAPAASESASAAEEVTVKVGILAREEPEIRFLAENLADEGVTLEYQIFDDNIALNRATFDGSLDANYFQNETYLEAQNQSTGQDLESYGPWLQTQAVQFVSSKYDSAKDLPDGAVVGIANDQANRARELQLLAANGLIELAKGVDSPSTLDITSNPKNIQWVEVDPRSRAGAFPDLDAMTAPSITVYLMNDPSINVLYEETPEVYEEYGGVVWVVPSDAGDLSWLDKAIAFMESAAYKDWIADYYSGIKKTPADS